MNRSYCFACIPRLLSGENFCHSYTEYSYENNNKKPCNSIIFNLNKSIITYRNYIPRNWTILGAKTGRLAGVTWVPRRAVKRLRLRVDWLLREVCNSWGVRFSAAQI